MIIFINSKKPILAVLGFILGSIIVLVFMGHHGYVADLLYLVTGILILYIKKIVLMLKNLRFQAKK